MSPPNAEVIVFPDAEAVLCAWLETRLAARGTVVPVGTRVPEPRPDIFVRVIRVGGPKHTLVTDAALMSVESWDTKESGAAELAQLCRGIINSAPWETVTTFYRVNEVSGPVSLPDPVSAHHRYSQTFEMHLRGTAA